jgi:hypothetical protein
MVHPGSSMTASSVAKPYFNEPGCTVPVDIYYTVHVLVWGRVAQSVYRLATGWTIRGSNPGGGEIFGTCPERPWGPLSLL